MSVENHERVVIRGLRGVTAATTQISFVDPLGALYYSGYNIDHLVDQATYEEVVYLLLNNKLPTKTQLNDLKSELFSEMMLPKQVVEQLTKVTADQVMPRAEFTR